MGAHHSEPTVFTSADGTLTCEVTVKPATPAMRRVHRFCGYASIAASFGAGAVALIVPPYLLGKESQAAQCAAAQRNPNSDLHDGRGILDQKADHEAKAVRIQPAGEWRGPSHEDAPVFGVGALHRGHEANDDGKGAQRAERNFHELSPAASNTAEMTEGRGARNAASAGGSDA